MALRVFQALRQPLIYNEKKILNNNLLNSVNKIEINQTRSVIYYDRNTGKRLNDEDAIKRFYRLNWGGFIRSRAGKKNHLWKKPWYIKWYTRQHVFCNEEMNSIIEKLITPEIKKPRHFIDDIYEPYHKRHGIDFCPHGQKQKTKSYIKSYEDY